MCASPQDFYAAGQYRDAALSGRPRSISGRVPGGGLQRYSFPLLIIMLRQISDVLYDIPLGEVEGTAKGPAGRHLRRR